MAGLRSQGLSTNTETMQQSGKAARYTAQKETTNYFSPRSTRGSTGNHAAERQGHTLHGTKGNNRLFLTAEAQRTQRKARGKKHRKIKCRNVRPDPAQFGDNEASQTI